MKQRNIKKKHNTNSLFRTFRSSSLFLAGFFVVAVVIVESAGILADSVADSDGRGVADADVVTSFPIVVAAVERGGATTTPGAVGGRSRRPSSSFRNSGRTIGFDDAHLIVPSLHFLRRKPLSSFFAVREAAGADTGAAEGEGDDSGDQSGDEQKVQTAGGRQIQLVVNVRVVGVVGKDFRRQRLRRLSRANIDVVVVVVVVVVVEVDILVRIIRSGEIPGFG